MKKIFVCETPYNVYIPILKSLNNKKGQNVLILTDAVLEVSELFHRLKKSGIFDDVFYIRYKNEKDLFLNNNTSKIKKIYFLLNLKKILIKVFEEEKKIYNKYYSVFKKSEINLFWGYHPLSRYLMLRHPNINFIEEGNGVYYSCRKHIFFKKIIRTIIGLPDILGGDKNVKKIEVSHPEKLLAFQRKKSMKLEIHRLEKKLSQKEKKDILDIFFTCKNTCFFNKNKALLITQPFSEDGEVTENDKVKMYTEIISKYMKGYNVYIKPHPREKTKYDNLFKDAEVLPKEFPLELFNLLDGNRFDLGITINSTALKNLKGVKEKKYLEGNYE